MKDVEVPIVAIYLNRACPRGCPQCGISKQFKPRLSAEDWKRAFTICRDYYNTKFFLVLGIEPLLLGQDLVDIVDFWTKNDFFYALYSTSPKKLFEKWRQPLLDVGCNNWSCGIDAVPDVMPIRDSIVRSKVEDGISGMQWMGERGAQTFFVTTMTNDNLDYIPEIVTWCQNNLPRTMGCVNPLEFQDELHDETFDFFSKKSEIPELIIPKDRFEDVRNMSIQLEKIAYTKGYYIQNSIRHIRDIPYFYDTLNRRCNSIVGMGIDCDGSFRRCGYNKGVNIANYTVWDVPDQSEKIYDIWKRDALSCVGCHWSWVYSLEEQFNAVEYQSDFYTNRWKFEEGL